VTTREEKIAAKELMKWRLTSSGREALVADGESSE
jgi:hypothetical protein